MTKDYISPIPQVFWSKSGLAAARPAATGLRDGSLWYSTDTKDIDQVQGGAWETILDYSATTTAMVAELTVGIFDLIPGIGTFINPERVNDGEVANASVASAVDEYVEFNFVAAVKLTQFHHYGHGDMTGDGTMKLQYKDLLGNWNDWVTGILTRGATWSNWDNSGGEVIAVGIKLIITALDTNFNNNKVGELEVKY